MVVCTSGTTALYRVAVTPFYSGGYMKFALLYDDDPT